MRAFVRPLLAVALLGLGAGTTRAQYGPMLTGAGPVNRGMGGVAVASPQSPSGAIFWNPATMTGFSRSEVDFGLEFLTLDGTLRSQYTPGAFGPRLPAGAVGGSTRSNANVFPLPNVGLVYRPEESPFAFGLGVNAVAGFGVDYPGGNGNPVLGPPPPTGLGVGPVFSDYSVLQVAPSVAYEVTDNFSVAAGPVVTLGRLLFAPGLFLPPDDANGDGFPSYPSATHSRYSWGAGFVVGLYYHAETWAAGVSYRSPQWSEPYRFNLADERGAARGTSTKVELPGVVSWGVSYTGFERCVLAADMHYLGYGQATGFGDSGFRPNGAAAGLGFRDMFAVALGTQYLLTDRLTVRAGYSYGTNPVPNDQTGVNLASPVVVGHILTTGATWQVTDDFTLSLAYLHGFTNSITGPLLTANGPVPGATVGTSMGLDSIVVGAGIKFGPPR